MDTGFLVEQDSSATPADFDFLDESQVIAGRIVWDSKMTGNQAFLTKWIGALICTNDQPIDLSDVIKTFDTGFPHDRFSSIP